MRARGPVFLTGQRLARDVGTPQVRNLVPSRCPWFPGSGKLSTGRIVVAVNAERGLAHAGADKAPQERWSRGCRRADVSFWSSLWLLPWLLAPRKKKKSWSLIRSRLSRPKPANTSDLSARARQSRLTGPAPYCPRSLAFATRSHIPSDPAYALCLWANAELSLIRPSGRPDKGQNRC